MYNKNYEKWCSSNLLSEALKNQLLEIKDNEQEKKLRFSKDISFGTAGLRGILGVGNGCMNEITVGWITRGVANMLRDEKMAERGVVVGRDSRNMSLEFAKITACVFAAYGVKVYLFDDIRPTAQVSFAVRQLNCAAGVNITASHNPKIYNGYKLYWEDGAQISPAVAEKVVSFAGEDILCPRDIMDYNEAVEKGLIKIIGKEIDELYLDEVSASVGDVYDYNKNLKVVYTPIHGSGYKLVPALLKRRGYQVYLVEEQMTPNGDFPTCDPPNPERIEAYTYALDLAKKVDADIILATDPDADRQGALIKVNGEYQLLTGNQIGVFLCDYRLTGMNLNGFTPYVVKSLVSTDMVRPICEDHNATLYNVLTGFKYIGEQIALRENKDNRFVFGFEESYGYLGKGYARDKDAVFASNCFAQAAAYFKNKGMSVYDRMEYLYQKYGYYCEKTAGLDLDPITGKDDVAKSMSEILNNPPKKIDKLNIENIIDYSKGVNGLPKADIIELNLEGGSKLIIRPSGTEPKVKLYALCKADSMDNSKALCDTIIDAAKKLLGL